MKITWMWFSPLTYYFNFVVKNAVVVVVVVDNVMFAVVCFIVISVSTTFVHKVVFVAGCWSIVVFTTLLLMLKSCCGFCRCYAVVVVVGKPVVAVDDKAVVVI